MTTGAFADLVSVATIGRRQIVLLAAGTFVLFTDGFDSQTVSFAAPALQAAWHLSQTDIGHVFAANLFGLMLGALVVTPLADLFSRRLVTLASIGAFGLLSLCTPLLHTVAQLAGVRFVTGLALGGAMPGIIVSVSEFLPLRLRARLLAVQICGYSSGFAGAGIAAAILIKPFGWGAVFVLGGLLPLLLLPLLFAVLPESPARLATLGRTAEAQAVLRSMGVPMSGEPAGGLAPRAKAVFPALLLFRSGMAPLTVALWLAYFCSGTTLYFVTNWLPLLVNGASYGQGTAALVATALVIGGMGGGIFVGALVDWRGVPALCATYGAACCCVIGIGLSAARLPMLLAAAALAGFFVVGSQNGLNAFVGGAAYPASFRVTGLGWGLAVTRLARLTAASLFGAYVVGLHLPPPLLFLIFGIPEALAALSLFWVGQRQAGPGRQTRLSVWTGPARPYTRNSS